MLFMALIRSENGGAGTAYFEERSGSARGIQDKNCRKRRDGFQFVTREKLKIFSALSALHLWNSMPQDTMAGKEIQQKKLLFGDRLNFSCS